jgi:hypothetical protein
MDLTLNLFSYYAIFCITTLVCILRIQFLAIRSVGIEFGWVAGTTYYTVTIGSILLLAPMFFIVFVFRSRNYYKNLIEYLTENFT